MTLLYEHIECCWSIVAVVSGEIRLSEVKTGVTNALGMTTCWMHRLDTDEL